MLMPNALWPSKWVRIDMFTVVIANMSNLWIQAVKPAIDNYTDRYNLFSTRYHANFIELSVAQRECEITKGRTRSLDIIESMMKEISLEIESEKIKLVMVKNEGSFIIVPSVINPVVHCN